jgi:hypothetical protein
VICRLAPIFVIGPKQGGGVEMLLSYQPKTIVTGFNKNSKNQKIGQFLYKIYFLKFGEK